MDGCTNERVNFLVVSTTHDATADHSDTHLSVHVTLMPLHISPFPIFQYDSIHYTYSCILFQRYLQQIQSAKLLHCWRQLYFITPLKIHWEVGNCVPNSQITKYQYKIRCQILLVMINNFANFCLMVSIKLVLFNITIYYKCRFKRPPSAYNYFNLL